MNEYEKRIKRIKRKNIDGIFSIQKEKRKSGLVRFVLRFSENGFRVFCEMQALHLVYCVAGYKTESSDVYVDNVVYPSGKTGKALDANVEKDAQPPVGYGYRVHTNKSNNIYFCLERYAENIFSSKRYVCLFKTEAQSPVGYGKNSHTVCIYPLCAHPSNDIYDGCLWYAWIIIYNWILLFATYMGNICDIHDVVRDTHDDALLFAMYFGNICDIHGDMWTIYDDVYDSLYWTMICHVNWDILDKYDTTKTCNIYDIYETKRGIALRWCRFGNRCIHTILLRWCRFGNRCIHTILLYIRLYCGISGSRCIHIWVQIGEVGTRPIHTSWILLSLYCGMSIGATGSAQPVETKQTSGYSSYEASWIEHCIKEYSVDVIIAISDKHNGLVKLRDSTHCASRSFCFDIMKGKTSYKKVQGDLKGAKNILVQNPKKEGMDELEGLLSVSKAVQNVYVIGDCNLLPCQDSTWKRIIYHPMYHLDGFSGVCERTYIFNQRVSTVVANAKGRSTMWDKKVSLIHLCPIRNNVSTKSLGFLFVNWRE